VIDGDSIERTVEWTMSTINSIGEDRGMGEAVKEVLSIETHDLVGYASAYAERRLERLIQIGEGDTVGEEGRARLHTELSSLFSVAFCAGVAAGREDARREVQALPDLG
jgi:hypothetical protein